MPEPDCVRFLQWALPRLGLRWQGFQKVHRQVCKRLERRRRELGLASLGAYRGFLETHPDEWQVLDGFCCITISRFYRDRGVFEGLAAKVLPVVAAEAAYDHRAVTVWSAGCASGEEPYTVALLWAQAVAPAFPTVPLRVLATDIDAAVLERARDGRYDRSSLRDLPAELSRGFELSDDSYVVRPELKRLVRVERHDLRTGPPDGPFDLVLCRNVAFTYFDSARQLEACATLAAALRPGGALVAGVHESLPPGATGFAPWPGARAVYRRGEAAANS